MNEEHYSFDANSFRRLWEAVKRIESTYRNEVEKWRSLAVMHDEGQSRICICSNSTPNSDGYYAGSAEYWNQSSKAFTTGETVWLRDANGGALTSSMGYAGRRVGIYSDGKPIYMVSLAAANELTTEDSGATTVVTPTTLFEIGSGLSFSSPGANKGLVSWPGMYAIESGTTYGPQQKLEFIPSNGVLITTAEDKTNGKITATFAADMSYIDSHWSGLTVKYNSNTYGPEPIFTLQDGQGTAWAVADDVANTQITAKCNVTITATSPMAVNNGINVYIAKDPLTDYAVIQYYDHANPADQPAWTSNLQTTTVRGRNTVYVGFPSNASQSFLTFNVTNQTTTIDLFAYNTDKSYSIGLPEQFPTADGQTLAVKTISGTDVYLEFDSRFETGTSDGASILTGFGNVFGMYFDDTFFQLSQPAGINPYVWVEPKAGSNYQILATNSGTKPSLQSAPQITGPITVGVSTTTDGAVTFCSGTAANNHKVTIKGNNFVQDATYLLPTNVPAVGDSLKCSAIAGTVYTMQWYTPSSGSGSTPTGVVAMWPGASISPPSGWLVCDGSTVSRTTYAALYAAIGTTYGAGDGSTTFTLPDFRSRMPIGAGQGTGLSNRAMGGTGGEETHALTNAELPYTQLTEGGSVQNLLYTTTGAGTYGIQAYGPGMTGVNTANIDTFGSTTPAHNNMPPWLGINFIIKT